MTGWRAKQLRQRSQHECGQSPAGPWTLWVCLEGIRGSGKSRAFVHALSITLVGQGSWFVSSFDAELPIAVSHLPAP